MMEVKRLSKKNIERILSSQVIVDLNGMLKELVENSIDSKAKTIKILCADYGIEFLEVSDDGSGVSFESLQNMCKFGGTSKIEVYEDLEDLSSFGFRGEGLASIRQMSNIEITTRPPDSETGFKSVYSINTETPVIESVNFARGTSIKVIKPFINDRIKREDLEKTAKFSFRYLVEYVQIYALIRPEIKFEFFNIVDGTNKCIFNYNQNSTVKTRIQEIYGYQIGDLVEECRAEDPTKEIMVKAYCSNLITSGSLKSTVGIKKSELKMIVNDKPAYPIHHLRALVERVYMEYNPNAKYFVILILTVPQSWVDFNLSKDKREMKLTNTDKIKKVVNSLLENFLSEKKGNQKVIDTSEFGKKGSKINNWAQLTQNENIPEEELYQESSIRLPQKLTRQDEDAGDSQLGLSPRTPSSLERKDSNSDSQNSLKNGDKKLKSLSFGARVQSLVVPLSQTSLNINTGQLLEDSDTVSEDEPSIQKPKITVYSKKMDQEFSKPSRGGLENSENARNLENFGFGNQFNENSQNEGQIFKKPMQRMNLGHGNIPLIYPRADQCCHQTAPNPPLPNPIDPANTSPRKDGFFESAQLVSRLEATDLDGKQDKFLQSNFSELRVIGQFNKGFIICKWRENDGRYFVVDQHAAAEKDNYERLLSQVKFNTQVLIAPIQIPVSILECMLVEDNIKSFEANGFRLSLQKDPEANLYFVQLHGVPEVFARNYTAGDFRDLLYLISVHGVYVEDHMMPKVKRDIATKACRQSFKVGDPLDLDSMTAIVKRLAELNHPWNCPHGRPTTVISSNVREHTLDVEAIKARLYTLI